MPKQLTAIKDCEACPFNVGHPACDEAYNLGCLPDVGQIVEIHKTTGKDWECHSKARQVCKGWREFKKENKIEGTEGLQTFNEWYYGTAMG